MYNLLVETNNAQVEVGSFGEIGDVKNVLLDNTTSKEGQTNGDEDTSAEDTAKENGDDGSDEEVGATTKRGIPDSSSSETQFENERGKYQV